MAYLGFKDGFQEAQKVTTSFIYNQYHPSISSPLVASINAKLASIFDQSFKSMNWLRSVYGNDFKGRKQSSSSANSSEINSPQVGRNSTNFLPQSHSTPIFHPRAIPPLFESPESNQSLSLSFSLSSSLSSAKENEENWNESSNVIRKQRSATVLYLNQEDSLYTLES
ncbi:unnamed protein product [Onchocerca ochengi]|uniref:Uncharacterized protein n=1 Tax=Onchocerca ochengi TaxID=42157 RepID=A0A182EHH1_ONCOC|nr:unnamed protein product [Onchocerca ochengi]